VVAELVDRAAVLAANDLIGIAREAHFFFKRARRLEHSYGDSAQHRERIARLTLGS